MPASRRILGFLTAALVVSAVATVAPASATGNSKLGFRPAMFIDTQLAGSEGFVLEASKTHRLIYVTHEGTTLLYRSGLQGSPTGDSDYILTYRNQVNMWTSDDHGRSWKRVNWNGTGFFTPPTGNLGFSDPDITEDGSGRVYATGIDLANDALVSSTDGGKTWPTGTVQCHEGDRPWLAGGRGEEVFLATDSEQYGHIVVRSTNGGASCGSAFADGQLNGWEGFGKMVYDAASDTIYEAAVGGSSLGVMALRHATSKFDSGSPGNFEIDPAYSPTSFNTFWKAQIALGTDHTLYLTWTDNPRKGGSSGCNGAASPAANTVWLVSSRNGGKTWSKPFAIAHPGTTVNWPWIIAGSAGRIAVAWYQYDRIVDLPCAPAAAAMGVRVAMLTSASSAHPHVTTVDPVGRPVHYGQVCDSGTTCVATGQDRRLGEFFTLNPDDRGCVMIATGDTTRKDPVTGAQLPTSRPLFTLQDRGTSLTGRSCAANASRLPNLGGTGGSSGSGKGPAGSGAGSLANSGGTLAAPLFGAGLLALGLAVLAARRRPGRGES